MLEGFARHNFVFANRYGGPLHETAVPKSPKTVAVSVDLPCVLRLHNLHHTNATLPHA